MSPRDPADRRSPVLAPGSGLRWLSRDLGAIGLAPTLASTDPRQPVRECLIRSVQRRAVLRTWRPGPRRDPHVGAPTRTPACKTKRVSEILFPHHLCEKLQVTRVEGSARVTITMWILSGRRSVSDAVMDGSITHGPLAVQPTLTIVALALKAAAALP